MSTDRIVLFGGDAASLELARHLEEHGYDFLIVTRHREEHADADARGYPCITADYTRDSELQTLGIGTDVSIVFCRLEQMSENVFITLSIRALNAQCRIISISDSQDTAEKLQAAGADKIINPYSVSAGQIHQYIRHPTVLEVMHETIFGHQNLELAEVVIPANSSLINQALADLRIKPDYNLILLGAIDPTQCDRLIFTGAAQGYRLTAEDLLVLIGPADNLETFRQALADGQETFF